MSKFWAYLGAVVLLLLPRHALAACEQYREQNAATGALLDRARAAQGEEQKRLFAEAKASADATFATATAPECAEERSHARALRLAAATVKSPAPSPPKPRPEGEAPAVEKKPLGRKIPVEPGRAPIPLSEWSSELDILQAELVAQHARLQSEKKMTSASARFFYNNLSLYASLVAKPWTPPESLAKAEVLLRQVGQSTDQVGINVDSYALGLAILLQRLGSEPSQYLTEEDQRTLQSKEIPEALRAAMTSENPAEHVARWVTSVNRHDKEAEQGVTLVHALAQRAMARRALRTASAKHALKIRVELGDGDQCQNDLRRHLLAEATKVRPLQTRIYDESNLTAGRADARIRATVVGAPDSSTDPCFRQGSSDKCLQIEVGIQCKQREEVANAQEQSIEQGCSVHHIVRSAPFEAVCSVTSAQHSQLIADVVVDASEQLGVAYTFNEGWAGTPRLVPAGDVKIELSDKTASRYFSEALVYSSVLVEDPSPPQSFADFGVPLRESLDTPAFGQLQKSRRPNQLVVAWSSAGVKLRSVVSHCADAQGKCTPLAEINATLEGQYAGLPPERLACTLQEGKHNPHCLGLALRIKERLLEYLLQKRPPMKVKVPVEASPEQTRVSRLYALASGSMPFYLDHDPNNDTPGHLLTALEVGGYVASGILFWYASDAGARSQTNAQADSANRALAYARGGFVVSLALPRVLGLVVY